MVLFMFRTCGNGALQPLVGKKELQQRKTEKKKETLKQRKENNSDLK